MDSSKPRKGKPPKQDNLESNSIQNTNDRRVINNSQNPNNNPIVYKTISDRELSSQMNNLSIKQTSNILSSKESLSTTGNEGSEFLNNLIRKSQEKSSNINDKMNIKDSPEIMNNNSYGSFPNDSQLSNLSISKNLKTSNNNYAFNKIATNQISNNKIPNNLLNNHNDINNKMPNQQSTSMTYNSLSKNYNQNNQVSFDMLSDFPALTNRSVGKNAPSSIVYAQTSNSTIFNSTNQNNSPDLTQTRQNFKDNSGISWSTAVAFGNVPDNPNELNSYSPQIFTNSNNSTSVPTPLSVSTSNIWSNENILLSSSNIPSNMISNGHNSLINYSPDSNSTYNLVNSFSDHQNTNNGQCNSNSQSLHQQQQQQQHNMVPLEISEKMLSNVFGMANIVIKKDSYLEKKNYKNYDDYYFLELSKRAIEPVSIRFQSPFSDTLLRSNQIDISPSVGYTYELHNSVKEKLPIPCFCCFSEDLLFYLYYMCDQTVLQAASAMELYDRSWRFHKDERIWILYRNFPVNFKIGRTTCVMFDPILWKKVMINEANLDISMFEEKVQYNFPSSDSNSSLLSHLISNGSNNFYNYQSNKNTFQSVGANSNLKQNVPSNLNSNYTTATNHVSNSNLSNSDITASIK